MLVRLEGDRAEVRPLAGTRPRGSTPEEDEALAEEELVKKARAGLLVEKDKKKEIPSKGENLRTFNVFVDDEYFEVGVEAADGAPVISYVQPMQAEAPAPAAATTPVPPQAVTPAAPPAPKPAKEAPPEPPPAAAGAPPPKCPGR